MMGWQWRQLGHDLRLAPDKNYASTSSLDALPDIQPTVSSTEGHENPFGPYNSWKLYKALLSLFQI